ncbi:uncharacterized protein LACBIDRAFT_299718 [Laccaria bicolor S238N-H82]|uniref:Predicted protein n=1 Tax=Laccaria bicolor (strain S238N-H82 / ATCC MYA-4686) TaxID=486041 RepID=B0DF95_LACBS|nr:uncharacterized protein LACBIDRAFT_299718 [Laccaria bicolor S238N-H82]EDR06670.1 predicted protein [Laccaria bicolor S238N-H82]|eukprot:XP_001882517.1 predicted protein [Laccaria bicolor S238N-H82]
MDGVTYTSIAGTSLFQTEEGYFGSISQVSPADGSHRGTKTFSISSVSKLTELIEPTLSQFSTRAEYCTMSIGLVDDSNREDIRDSLNAISESIGRRNGFPYPVKQYEVTHADAYCGTLPSDESIFYIMFLDFAPNRIASETLVTVYDDDDEDGGRKVLRIWESNVSIAESVSLEDAISSVAVYAGEPPLSRIVLINPPPSLTPTLHATLPEIHPGVPIIVSSASDISQALATHQYLEFGRWSNCCCFSVGTRICPPICIASATGVAMPLVDLLVDWDEDCPQERVFSTSVDNQTTATLRLLLGDHPLAKDNVERGVIALEGLDPRPRGVGCIQVTATSFPDMQGFWNMLTVKVEQLTEDGQKCPRTTSKMFIFPHFFPNIRDEKRYMFDARRGYEYNSEEVQWELPE